MSYNYESQYNSPNYTAGRAGMQYIVIHWWDDPAKNPSYEGVIATLCNPNRQASAHYVVTGTGRRSACLVAPGDTAWHAGNWTANQNSIGIECDPRCRDEDYDVVAEVIADIRSAFGNLPLRRHSDFMATRCPGNYDLNRLNAIADTKYSTSDEWGKVATKPTPKPPEPPVIPPVEPPVEPPVVEPPIVVPELTPWEKFVKWLKDLINKIFGDER